MAYFEIADKVTEDNLHLDERMRRFMTLMLFHQTSREDEEWLAEFKNNGREGEAKCTIDRAYSYGLINILYNSLCDKNFFVIKMSGIDWVYRNAYEGPLNITVNGAGSARMIAYKILYKNTQAP